MTFDVEQTRIAYADLIKRREDLNNQRHVINNQVTEIERQMRVIEHNWDQYLKAKVE